jgi:type II secretory pathway component PulF
MPNYRFNATNASGKWSSGEISSSNLESAREQLRAGGMVIESLLEVEEPRVSGRLTKTEVVELVEQLAALSRAGMPLPAGLRAAANELVSPRLRSTFHDLANRIDSGVDLEDALASGGNKFPSELRGLVLAGSKSGRLTDLLSEFVRAANLGAELRRLFWSALLYPSILLIAVLVIVRFVCGIALQSVAIILKDFGVDQPANTKFLMILSAGIVDHGTEVVLALFFIPWVIWLTIWLTSTPAKRRRILCGLPLVGPILRFCSLTEFCHRLAMLLEAELPMPTALELAGSSVGDADVAEACRQMGRAVEAGEPFSKSVRLWDAFPAGLGQLFLWSEDRRTLPEALHMAGDLYESQARSQSSFARSVLSTMLLFFIFWWVGFAVAALYLPLISLISKLSG